MGKNEIETSEINKWIEEDENLSNLLVEIQELPISIEEQAEIAFHRLSEMYNLSKTPDDIVYKDVEDENEDYIEQTSVYEQLGPLKYLNSNDDLRGNVLLAVYFVKNGLVVDSNYVLEKYYKTTKTKIVGIGLKGENSKVEIIFIKKGESWFDLGCKVFNKFI